MKKIIYILSVVAVIAAIIAVLVFNKRSTDRKTQMVAADAASAIAVRVLTVDNSNYSVGFSSSGVLEAVRDLQFASDVAGRIISIHANEGDYVTKGKLLIQLDNEMLKADANSSETTYEGLKKDYERFKRSNEQGGVTDQQLDNIYTQMIAAENQNIAAQRRLRDASIKAPIAGTIYKRYVEVGSYLNPGTVLFDIIDDSQLKAMCYATEKQVLGLKKGQPVKLTSETFPGEVLEGTITFVGEKADRSLNFPVEVAVANHNKELKSGMYVSVLFDSDTQKQGVLIPRNAISGSVQAANVFVVENGIAKRKNVTIGNMVGEQVEITEGLQAGESIVFEGLINISDGAEVRVVQ